jgi:hypothetical protein
MHLERLDARQEVKVLCSAAAWPRFIYFFFCAVEFVNEEKTKESGVEPPHSKGRQYGVAAMGRSAYSDSAGR